MNELEIYKQAIDISTLVLVMNEEEDIVYANKKFCDAMGYQGEEIIGKNPRIFNSGFHPKDFFTEMRETLAQMKSWHGEIRNKTKSGTHVWMDTIIFPFYPTGSDKVHYLAIRHDIDRQLDAIKSREHFITNLSHEIRTPLHGVLNIVELLSQSDLGKEQREYVNIIRSASQSLFYLLNDALDVFKIGVGKIKLESIDFNLKEELESIIALYKPKVKEKNLLIVSSIDPAIPLILKGDPNRLRQIVTNLVDNAVKYTSEGSIIVIAEVEKMCSNQCTLFIKVKDSGMGIEQSKQELIFEKFSQANISDSREHGGVGIGLHIVKELVEIMNGEIQLISSVGIGAEFVLKFTFPISIKNKVLRAENGNKLFPKTFNILVADDSPINQMVFSKQILSLGCNHSVANNGAEALHILSSLNFDIILLDVQMPVMDGIEFLNQLNTNSKYIEFKSVPIVLVSAGNHDFIENMFPDLNIRGFLHKPFTSHQLKEILHKESEFLKKSEDKTNNTQPIESKVNLTYLEELAEGDKDFVDDIIRTFIIQSIQSIESLKNNFKTKQYDEVKRIAHKFGPQLAFVGLEQHIYILNNIEKNAGNKSEETHIGEQLVFLDKLITDTAKVLNLLINRA